MADEAAPSVQPPATPVTETEVEVPKGFQQVQARVTRQYMENQLVPVAQPLPKMPASVVKRDRETINALLGSADAVRYKMVVHRYWPTYEGKTGARYPTDSIMDVELMGLDELRRAIMETWGGGNYRVVVVDKNTNDVQDKFGCFVISIRLEECPAKLTRGTATGGTSEDEAERQSELREERRMASEKRRAEHEAALLRAQMEIEDIRSRRQRSAEGGNGKDSMTAVLEVVKMGQQAQEQRAAAERVAVQEQLRKDREDADRRERERQEQARRDREDADRRAKEEKEALLKTLSEMSSHMKEIQSAPRTDTAVDMVKALAPMLAPKQDSSMAALELMKSGQETMMRIADMNLKNVTREDRASSQERNQLLQALIGNRDNASSFRDYLQVLGEMKAEVREDIKLATSVSGSESEGEGYEPRLGFWGNTARAVFNGLTELAREAAKNPQLLHLVFRLFGTGRPTQEQMVRAANKMAQGQQPMLLTPPTGATPLLPQPAPVPGQPILLTPPQPRIPPAQFQQPATPPPGAQQQAVQQQVATATELEGETIGVGAGLEAVDSPEARLREFVTNAIKDCCDDIQDKREVREWWKYAHDWWNGDFKTAIATAPSDEMRVSLIQQQCSPDVWERLNNLIGSDATGQETVKFFTGLREFVALNAPKPVGTNDTDLKGAPGPVGPPGQPSTTVPLASIPVVTQVSSAAPTTSPSSVTVVLAPPPMSAPVTVVPAPPPVPVAQPMPGPTANPV